MSGPGAGYRCVVIVGDRLGAGLAANAAAVVTMSMGQRVDGLIGPDVKDADGRLYPGIVHIPVPILTAGADLLHAIWAEAVDSPEAVTVGFTSLAQSCRTYDEYSARMLATASADLECVAVGVHGPRRLVNRLAGSLPLLR